METFIIDTILRNQIFFVLWVRELFKQKTTPVMAYELAKVAFQKYPTVQSIRDELVDTNSTFGNEGLGFSNLGRSLAQKVVGTTDKNPLPHHSDSATRLNLFFQGIGQVAYNCMWGEPIEFNQELLYVRRLLNRHERWGYYAPTYFELHLKDIEQTGRDNLDKQLSQTKLFCESLTKNNKETKKLSTLIASFFSVVNAVDSDETTEPKNIDEETWANYYLIAKRLKEATPQETQSFHSLFEQRIHTPKICDISDYHWFGFKALVDCARANQRRKFSHILSELNKVATELEWNHSQIPSLIQAFLCQSLAEESLASLLPTFQWSEVVRKFQSFNEQ